MAADAAQPDRTRARRPADYTGTQGWAQRIASRTLTAAAVGAGVGSVVGLVRRQGAVRWAGAAASNGALVTASFCCAQELVRELRAAHPDDLVNALLGGLASGALLGRLQGGPARALPCALLFAGVGTGLQLAANELREYRLSNFVATLPDHGGEELVLHDIEKPAAQEWRWPDWFPIRRLTEEEAAKREAQREKSLRKTVENLRAGQSADGN